jgi:hypothetical protein
MQKLIQSCSLVFLLFLTIGQHLFSNSPIVFLTTNTASVIALRTVIIVGISLVLFTTPPRTWRVRLTLGILAATLCSWACYQLFNENVPLLDGLVLLVSATGFGLAALELTTPENSITVRSETQLA